jgi:hypothetical protein
MNERLSKRKQRNKTPVARPSKFQYFWNALQLLPHGAPRASTLPLLCVVIRLGLLAGGHLRPRRAGHLPDQRRFAFPVRLPIISKYLVEPHFWLALGVRVLP